VALPQKTNLAVSDWAHLACVQAGKFRREVTAARADAEFHVKASAAIVASAIDAAPKVIIVLELGSSATLFVNMCFPHSAARSGTSRDVSLPPSHVRDQLRGMSVQLRAMRSVKGEGLVLYWITA